MNTPPPVPERNERVELLGYDEDGRPQTTPLPEGAAAADVEAEVRAAGGRVAHSRVIRMEGAQPKGTTPEEFARFNEMLATAVRRRVPLMEGVRALAQEVQGGRFRDSLERVQENLSRGEPLREAFSREKAGLPTLYGRLIEAGAAARSLPGVLMALSRNVRNDALFRRSLLECMIYPAFLFLVSCVLLSGAAVALVPRYDVVNDELKTSLPVLTKLMLARVVPGPPTFLLALLAAILLGVLFILWLNAARAGRRLRERILRRTPLLRGMYEAVVWANTADTLALLIDAKVPAPDALRLVAPAVGSQWLNDSLVRLVPAVESGESLSIAAESDPDIPTRVARAFEEGEAHNDMASAMASLAEEYRHEWTQRARRFVRLVPPALALLFGVFVFLVAVATLGPYIDLWRAPW